MARALVTKVVTIPIKAIKSGVKTIPFSYELYLANRCSF